MRVHRHASKLRWASIALIALGLFALMSAVPADQVLERLRSRIDGYGALGPLVYAGLFVLGVLAFFPGTALTLASGALLGFPVGACVASLSATTGALIAFLLARYLLRARVERALTRHPRFAAIDAAVAAEGGRIIFLLRLSPLIPFSLANYAYGMTAVRGAPYVFATWAATLPATLVYVYMGHVGGGAIAGERPTSLQWSLFGVGLGTTLIATVIVARIARTRLARSSPDAAADNPAPGSTATGAAAPVQRLRAGTWLLAAAALSIWGGVLFAHLRPQVLAALLGPPSVRAVEAYPRRPGGPVFDHAAWGRVLARHVQSDGRVDYAALAQDTADLERYLDELATAELDALGRDERLALALNAYNAFTLRLVLDHLPLASIRDIPAAERWRGRSWLLGGAPITLEELEHGEVRAHYVDARVHFALNCASASCPSLAAEPFRGARLEQQLDACARRAHGDPHSFAFDPASRTLRLTRLYDWYASDFARDAGSTLEFAARYDAQLAAALARGEEPRVEWIPYDWSLNAAP